MDFNAIMAIKNDIEDNLYEFLTNRAPQFSLPLHPIIKQDANE